MSDVDEIAKGLGIATRNHILGRRRGKPPTYGIVNELVEKQLIVEGLDGYGWSKLCLAVSAKLQGDG